MSKDYKVVTQEILEGLKAFNGYYSQDYYLEFESRIATMKERIKMSLDEGRLLKIGIVGEVKAGKSSFINALVFDGKDILPKASTPMTAALTKITYAPHSSAKIVFYNDKEWERVEQFSNEYDRQLDKLYNEYVERQTQTTQSMRVSNMGMTTNYHVAIKSREEMKKSLEKNIALKLRACKEVTTLAEASHIDISNYFGKEMILDKEAVRGGLKNYIGANGEYTAIVKHVELQMDNELLKGVEIVDTPGLNDPIISRGELTKQFLGDCDAVFLLSYCGQFLSQEDISFMCETLPNEGIRNVIIVGSKFDSGVTDYNKSNHISDALNKSKRTYDEMARNNINRALSSRYHAELLQRIRESLPPSYISAILYSCAMKKKKGEPLSEEEEKVISNLSRFNDFKDDEENLFTLSGIKQIRVKKIQPIMKNKQAIIREKNREVVADNKRMLLKLLEDINMQAFSNKDELEHCDKEKLENKLQTLENKLNTMRRDIRNIFQGCSVEAECCLNKIATNIELEIENYVDFEVTASQHVEHGSYRTGFLGLCTEHYTETITTYSASVSDVISNMRKYITRCKVYCNSEFEKIININKLEKMVKETVIGAFDLSGKEFNENDILIPLEIVTKKIQIPKINIEVAQFEHMIVDAFSGAVVKGEAIHDLKLEETRVLSKIAQAIQDEIKKCENEVKNMMLEQSVSFVDNIINQLTMNVEMLQKQIENKESSIKQYNKLCEEIMRYKQLVREMEI